VSGLLGDWLHPAEDLIDVEALAHE